MKNPLRQQRFPWSSSCLPFHWSSVYTFFNILLKAWSQKASHQPQWNTIWRELFSNINHVTKKSDSGFMRFFTLLRRMSGWYLEIDYDNFLANNYLLNIYDIFPYHWMLQITSTTKTTLLNNVRIRQILFTSERLFALKRICILCSCAQGLYLNAGQHKHRINTYTHQTFMPWPGFEPTIPASERAKTVHALDRAVTVTRLSLHTVS
jgi:hypothetical protein